MEVLFFYMKFSIPGIYIIWKQICSCFCFRNKFKCKFRIRFWEKNLKVLPCFFFFSREIHTLYKLQTPKTSITALVFKKFGSTFEMSPLPNKAYHLRQVLYAKLQFWFVILVLWKASWLVASVINYMLPFSLT